MAFQSSTDCRKLSTFGFAMCTCTADEVWECSDRINFGGETAVSFCASSSHIAWYTRECCASRLYHFFNKKNCISSLVHSAFDTGMAVLTLGACNNLTGHIPRTAVKSANDSQHIVQSILSYASEVMSSHRHYEIGHVFICKTVRWTSVDVIFFRFYYPLHIAF